MLESALARLVLADQLAEQPIGEDVPGGGERCVALGAALVRADRLEDARVAERVAAARQRRLADQVEADGTEEVGVQLLGGGRDAAEGERSLGAVALLLQLLLMERIQGAVRI